MHGLALRAVQLFVNDCHGAAKWAKILNSAGFEFDEFEAMLDYEEEVAQKLLVAMTDVLERPASDILEDIGTYLVSHPNVEALRRLLRFGGVTFEEFLHSLDELPDRARLAVPDLVLPSIELREHSAVNFSIICQGNFEGFGHVLAGLLRTMADDYGALAFVEHGGGGQGAETLSVTLLEATFSEGRKFDLGAHVA